MRFFKSSLLYLSVAVILGGYIWFFERKPKEEEAAKKDVLFNFVADDVERITLINRKAPKTDDRELIVLTKNVSGNWAITKPRLLEADQNEVRNILSTATALEPEALIENPQDLVEFNLQDPPIFIAFQHEGGKSATLFIGDKTINEQSYYAKAHHRPNVAVLAAASAGALIRTVPDLRNKVLYATGYAEARQVVMERPGRDAVHLERREDTWKLRRPDGVWVTADEDETRQILNVVNGIRIQEFFDRPNLSAMGLGDRHRGIIRIWPTEKSPQVEIVLGNKMKDRVYVRRKDQPFAASVMDIFDRDTDKKWTDFRDKSAIRFVASEARKLTVGKTGKQIIFERSEEGVWSSPGRDRANEEAMGIIEALSVLRVQEFADRVDANSAGTNAPLLTAEVSLMNGKTRHYRFGKRLDDKVYLAADGGRDIYLVFPSASNSIENVLAASAVPINP
jgi:hypothetical protein